MSAVIRFIPSGRGKAQCAPNPAYPDGIAIDARKDHIRPWCVFKVPYPAPECGLYSIACDVCGTNALVTAAGRPDDPVSVTLTCKKIT